MELDIFLQRLKETPEDISFSDTMALVDELYAFTPTAFRNGSLLNEAGQNNGSCRLFSFARLQGLSHEQTLYCFGDYYRKDVLGNPEGADHQNIRNFIKTGWDGVSFEGSALTPKKSA